MTTMHKVFVVALAVGHATGQTLPPTPPPAAPPAGAVAATAPVATASPADGEVPLPALADWCAFLVHQSDVGVWYVRVDKVVDAYGQNEIVAADDKGRFVLLTVYSGKWTATAITPDGQWLAPSGSADVDPRVPGRELYAAGKGGSVHRIALRPQPFGKFTLECIEIGHQGGEEFHAVLAADVDPTVAGDELLVFGITGACYQLRANGDGDAFTMRSLARLPGRVRDTVVVPAARDSAPWIVGASRSGDLLALRLVAGELEQRVIAHEDSGLGRIARRPAAGGGTEALYVTRDDGLLLRFEQQGDTWRREPIYAGAQGLRGVAAGRFYQDGREAVAVYGYGKEVQLVARGEQGWEVETIFRDEQQGHFLAVAELDGRNATDELVASGFGGKVVLLTRPPGYGLEGVAVKAAIPLAPAAVGRR